MSKAICMKCKKELKVTEDNGYNVEKCLECGDEGFIAGTNGLSVMEDKVTCNCEDPSFSLKMHINMEPRSYYEYACKCGNTIVMN